MWSDNETTQDLLGYQVHADLLQKIILNESMLPISIGVFGNWGSGKSSLMLLLKKGIESSIEGIQKSNKALPADGVKENDKILQVNFNSWQFESYDSTKLTMIETILDALSNDINEKKDVFEKADDFFARIKFLKAGVFILKKVHENLTPDCIKKWLPSKEELDVITGKDKLTLEQKLQRVCQHKEQGEHYSDFIRKYEQRTQLFGVQRDYVCPICGKENEELSIEALNILQAGDWLKKELCSFPEYKEKFDQEEKEIRKQLTALKAELAVYTKEYKENKELIEKIVTQKNLNEIRLKAQWKVMTEYEIYCDRKVDFDEKDLDLQKGELEKAKERLKTYNVGEKYVYEKSRLQDYMNIVIDSLDFEHTPPELRFELNPEKDDCFQLYHNELNDERIFLPQIGSASNSIACHVGLFLSFLHYFSVEKNSKVPGILFFDQPSQAYFPSGTDNKDLEKVAQIYETILKVLQETEQDAGFLPQVIVADHIRDLGEQNVQLYEHYFRADWRDGRAFI